MMRYRQFGPTDLKLSAIGLGAMPMSVTRNRPDEQDAIAVIHHAIDCGINLIDTADSYCLDESEAGHNEKLIGKALALLPPHERQQITVATKGGFVRPQGRWLTRCRPQHLRAACERSLANLKTDTIAIYQLHRIDPRIPLAESIGELLRLRNDGKIRHVAVSNFNVDQIEEAATIVPIVSVQNQYGPRQRSAEHDGVLAASQQRGMAFIPWSPLGGMGAAAQIGMQHATIRAVASDHGVSPQQVALAWLMTKGPMVFPIPGASRRTTIEDSAGAADLDLSSDELEQIDDG